MTAQPQPQPAKRSARQRGYRIVIAGPETHPRFGAMPECGGEYVVTLTPTGYLDVAVRLESLDESTLDDPEEMRKLRFYASSLSVAYVDSLEAAIQHLINCGVASDTIRAAAWEPLH